MTPTTNNMGYVMYVYIVFYHMIQTSDDFKYCIPLSGLPELGLHPLRCAPGRCVRRAEELVNLVGVRRLIDQVWKLEFVQKPLVTLHVRSC